MNGQIEREKEFVNGFWAQGFCHFNKLFMGYIYLDTKVTITTSSKLASEPFLYKMMQTLS